MVQLIKFLQGLITQIKPAIFINLTAKKTFSRSVELHSVIQLTFWQYDGAAKWVDSGIRQ